MKIEIRANTKKIGDKIGDKIITGLGKTYKKFVRDDEACCYGLPPGENYVLLLQNAYCDDMIKTGSGL